MNKATHRIKMKGYTLTEFLQVKCISLSTYRRWEKEDNKFNDILNSWIDGLEVK